MDEVKNEAKLKTRKVIKIQKKVFIWTIIFVVLVILWMGSKIMMNTFKVTRTW